MSVASLSAPICRDTHCLLFSCVSQTRGFSRAPVSHRLVLAQSCPLAISLSLAPSAFLPLPSTHPRSRLRSVVDKGVRTCMCLCVCVLICIQIAMPKRRAPHEAQGSCLAYTHETVARSGQARARALAHTRFQHTAQHLPTCLGATAQL